MLAGDELERWCCRDSPAYLGASDDLKSISLVCRRPLKDPHKLILHSVEDWAEWRQFCDWQLRQRLRFLEPSKSFSTSCCRSSCQERQFLKKPSQRETAKELILTTDSSWPTYHPSTQPGEDKRLHLSDKKKKKRWCTVLYSGQMIHWPPDVISYTTPRYKQLHCTPLTPIENTDLDCY